MCTQKSSATVGDNFFPNQIDKKKEGTDGALKKKEAFLPYISFETLLTEVEHA